MSNLYWQMDLSFTEVGNSVLERRKGKELSIFLLVVCGTSKWKCPGSRQEAQECFGLLNQQQGQCGDYGVWQRLREVGTYFLVVYPPLSGGHKIIFKND